MTTHHLLTTGLLCGLLLWPGGAYAKSPPPPPDAAIPARFVCQGYSALATSAAELRDEGYSEDQVQAAARARNDRIGAPPIIRQEHRLLIAAIFTDYHTTPEGWQAQAQAYCERHLYQRVLPALRADYARRYGR